MPVLGNVGEPLDLRIRQGGTFGPHRVTLLNPDGTPVILTGCAYLAQIRKTAAAEEVAATLTVATVDELEGVFSFGLSAEETALLGAGDSPTDTQSRYVWDFELHDSLDRVIPIFYGNVSVLREVSRGV